LEVDILIAVYIILCAIVYVMIGGLAAGICNDDKLVPWFIALWPVLLVIGAVLLISRPMYKLGLKINEKFGGK
jgi:hypothetical protein